MDKSGCSNTYLNIISTSREQGFIYLRCIFIRFTIMPGIIQCREKFLEESVEYTMKYHFTSFTRKQLSKFLITMLAVLQIHILAISLFKIVLSTCVL